MKIIDPEKLCVYYCYHLKLVENTVNAKPDNNMNTGNAKPDNNMNKSTECEKCIYSIKKEHIMFDTNELNKAGALGADSPPSFCLIWRVKPPRFDS